MVTSVALYGFKTLLVGLSLNPLFILYILTIEDLAVAVYNNPAIKGIEIGSHQYKLSICADGLLLFVTSPHIFLPSIISNFKEFGGVSNFKFTYDKTEALNISLSAQAIACIQSNFPFKWL